MLNATTGGGAMRRLAAAFAVALVFAGGMATAQDTQTVQVRFPPGSTGTTIQDSIAGRESISYTVGAQAGQQMDVRLTSANTSIYFNIYGPGSGPGDAALAAGEMLPEINDYSGVLPASGTYTIDVFLYRNAARRGDAADFALDISISALENAAAPVEGDYADGLEGGPDFLRVETSGGVLNLRTSPSATAPVVTAVPSGTDLQNLGCRMNEGRRWCNVATLDSPNQGWAAGDFLVEGASAPPAPETASTDALVPGTDYNATGTVSCTRDMSAPMQDCAFGVTRDAPGTGMITISWPDGGNRVIGYENNRPSWYDESQSDGGAEMQVEQDGDMYTVTIGRQRFELFEAIMTGG